MTEKIFITIIVVLAVIMLYRCAKKIKSGDCSCGSGGCCRGKGSCQCEDNDEECKCHKKEVLRFGKQKASQKLRCLFYSQPFLLPIATKQKVSKKISLSYSVFIYHLRYRQHNQMPITQKNYRCFSYRYFQAQSLLSLCHKYPIS